MSLQSVLSEMNFQSRTIANVLSVLQQTPSVTILQVCIDPEFEPNDESTFFGEIYSDAISKHNANMLSQGPTPDAGFDLITPNKIVFRNNVFIKIGLGICVSAVQITTMGGAHSVFPVGLQLHSRSSTSKTCLRLAISSGIIDSGYRGEIKAVFDILPNHIESEIDAYSRLVQLVSPYMSPIIVEEVLYKSELFCSQTRRDAGGFGSTGV